MFRSTRSSNPSRATRPRRGGRVAGLQLAFAAVALLAHLWVGLHFASVAHVHDGDGVLRHLGTESTCEARLGRAHGHAGATPEADPAAPHEGGAGRPEGPADPEEDHGCPLQPPAPVDPPALAVAELLPAGRVWQGLPDPGVDAPDRGPAQLQLPPAQAPPLARRGQRSPDPHSNARA